MDTRSHPMSGRERLMRIFQSKEVDRPALKLWGLTLGQEMLHPAYQPVYDLAAATTDIMEGASSPLDIIWGVDSQAVTTVNDRPIPNSNWVDRHTEVKLPEATLHAVHRYSTIGEPGYQLEYLVKEPDHLRALLAVPYTAGPVDITAYQQTVAKVGERGIVVFFLDHAAYAVYRLMGSACFALMCLDQRELVREAVELYAKRIRQQVQAVFLAGIRPVFGWVGPEVCIPPLVRRQEFQEFVYAIDQPLCSLIHNEQGYVWVHCHGRVGHLLNDFANMGVDVLNPIEPPPQGDITLKEAAALVDDRMGLEGNIEIGALLESSRQEVEELVCQAVDEGKRSSRFILCPSAGYMEYVNPTSRYIDNLLCYLRYGLQCLG